MRIYISWSRTLGYHCAEDLNLALLEAFSEEAIRPYWSALHIETGADWFAVNQTNLRQADFAIVVVTRQGLSSPWLPYEAGILLERVNTACSLILCGVSVEDLAGHPFSHLQCCQCSAENIQRILEHVAEELPAVDRDRNRDRIRKVAEDTARRLRFLAKADNCIAGFQRLKVQSRKIATDPYLHDACAALKGAGFKRDDIERWMSKEEIDVAHYSNHLFKLFEAEIMAHRDNCKRFEAN